VYKEAGHALEVKFEGLEKAHREALDEYEKWIDIKKREEEVRLS
jgi:hypothetical protein